MTRGSGRLVAVFALLAAATVTVVVVWLVFFRPQRTVVHERPRPATVNISPIISAPLTPLDRVHRSAAARSPDSRGAPESSISPLASKPRGARNRPLSTKKHRTPKTPRKHRPTPQRPNAAPPPSNPAPAPSRRPPALVELNPPVGPTVCNPLVSVRCP